MGTIETIFENYKASYNEETSLSEGQDTAMSELEKATLINPASGQTAFDKAIALSRESEKAGFINRAIQRIYTEYNDREREKADEEQRKPQLIRHFSVHNLRHTFCTRFCENESNIKVIQEIMGHSDIGTTMNIYAEATEAKKRESFDNLEGKIKIS